MASHHDGTTGAPVSRRRPPWASSSEASNSQTSLLSDTANSRESSGYGAKSRRARDAAQALSFVAAVASALCAGSITAFSLYGPVFQQRLRYTQFQVNGLAIGSSVALYLPVSVLGYVCDRVGTAPLSALAAVLFGGGYGLAAAVYRRLDEDYARLGGRHGAAVGPERGGWTYPLMVSAFVCIGVATCAMYLSAVATCAKNFGRGRHRGLALAAPIAAFGLSGMWLSQVGSRWFTLRRPDGTPGDLDVFHFFVFLAALLFVVGLLGVVTLRVVDEDDLIDGAVEELERSGLLDGGGAGGAGGPPPGRGYGAADRELLDQDPDPDPPEEARRRKEYVLNAETRQFLTDRTMWLFALGFLLIIGPGDAFINNLGTVIGTLDDGGGPHTSAATHVSIVAITSTAARLLTGTLTDLLAPSPDTQHVQLSGSMASLRRRRRPLAISRVIFLLSFAAVLSLGLVALASGAIQGHADRFWIVSGLVGAGYGAVFSLTPIIITVIWGVENFATNWGIVAMLPALGSTTWGLIYSAVYEREAGGGGRPGAGDDDDADVFCHGARCYSSTFWAMAVTVWVACGFVLVAWRGRGGWAQRGIVI